MGKHTKLPASASASSTPTPKGSAAADPLARVEAHLLIVLEGLELAVAKGDASPATARESASTARAIVSVRAERRAAAKQAAKTATRVTPAMLADYIRHATTAERAQLRRDLDAADRKQRGGVFG